MAAPTIRIVRFIGDELDKYDMTEWVDELTVEGIEKFINDFFDGKLKPYLMSAEVPEKNDGPMKIVVSQTWSEIVGDTSKDVLTMYYSPVCGHCQALAPVWT